MTKLRQQIWDMYKAGTKPVQIAKLLDKSVPAIRNAIYLAREELEDDTDCGQDRPRCVCGLSLPCNDCTRSPEWQQRNLMRSNWPDAVGLDGDVSSNSDLRKFPLTSTVLPPLKLGNRELNGPSTNPIHPRSLVIGN